VKTPIKTFITSHTTKLAGTYVAIIMLMSVGFSFELYHVSSQQLGRQLPPNSLYGNQQPNNPNGGGVQGNQGGPPPEVDKFLQQRIREGRQSLVNHLVWLNISALCVGGVVSYVLARRSLKPIEQAMEAQAQFVSDASHELRTPLTAIQTSNEVFLRKPHATIASAKELISQNTDDVKRLKQLSDGLLNLAQHKRDTPDLSPVGLQDIMSEAMTQVAPQAVTKDIAVHDAISNTHVSGNKAALSQVLIILLDNAIKYSDHHKNIHVTSWVRGKNAYIEVRDEGIGIQATELSHVFRRFYRADAARSNSERGGYGLGLAIARQIIENHQGTISVDSTPGKGSTFTIKLPLA
jgi:signal transduction histidine kinase